jgi:hypothetical protein
MVMIHKFIIILFLFIVFYSDILLPQTSRCGEDISSRRVLTPGVGSIMPVMTGMQLQSISKTSSASNSKLVISILDHNFYSLDRADTFIPLKDGYCQQYIAPTIYPKTCILNSMHTNIIYKVSQDAQKMLEILLSLDGGSSWKTIQPKTVSGRLLSSLIIMSTSVHSPGRLFASGFAVGEKGIFMSEDYGSNFRPILPNKNVPVFENKSVPNILYAESSDGIIYSTDTGLTWKSIANSSELISPIYYEQKDDKFKSWISGPADRKYSPYPRIIQIETDPINPNIIYVLTFKGLYCSRGADFIFKLLPLARNMFLDIHNIAVDPVNSKYIYAAVGKKSLFRSSDYGCSWNEMKLPTVAPKGKPKVFY